MLAKLDRRTREARLLAAARAKRTSHVGGAPSHVQKALIERAARLMRAKSNIGRSHGGLRVRRRHAPARRPSGHQCAVHLVGRLRERERSRHPHAPRRQGGDADGRAQGREVIKEGEAAGLNERALRRALKALGGWSDKPSMKTGWIWELPEQAS
jgi:hypothetical protein